jgi:hypothetical protein
MKAALGNLGGLFRFGGLEMEPKKVSEAARKLGEELTKANFETTILVDDNGDPFFVWAWYRDIIVSNIFHKENK